MPTIKKSTLQKKDIVNLYSLFLINGMLPINLTEKRDSSTDKIVMRYPYVEQPNTIFDYYQQEKYLKETKITYDRIRTNNSASSSTISIYVLKELQKRYQLYKNSTNKRFWKGLYGTYFNCPTIRIQIDLDSL